MQNHKDITVVVAMSGGVDSSVAAALLVEQGYTVIGMMMRLWSEESFDDKQHNRCCTPEQMNDAQMIAKRLGIPFYVLDTKATFRNTVVQYFIDQHADGLTPNPCIECNRQIRFSFLQQNALALDADYLATGHYARITQADNGRYQLRMGVDPLKDQSYVLSVMGQEQLAHALFPLGGYEKVEIRKIAHDIGLTVHDKKDSQDLCFLGDGDYRRFLRDHAPSLIQPGEIRLASGESLGQHEGLVNYTIGQRRGIGVAHATPLYVIGKDAAQNALIVGEESELGQASLTAKRVNWVSGETPSAPFEAQVKIRYKAKPVPGIVTPLDDGRIHIAFEGVLRDITPGQGAILYQGDLCLGGGLIEADQ
ncbi:MAG: tRNA 2-thiouridine(34) synthase MnmA [Phototrophicaceae bacterium]